MSDTIDEKLLRECASAFCTAAGIGCTVTDAQGRLLFAQGYGCTQCELCAASAREAGVCMQTQLYGMREAERFGGSYLFLRHGYELLCFAHFGAQRQPGANHGGPISHGGRNGLCYL